MTKQFFIISFIMILSSYGYSQETNQIDNGGLKQGLWLIYKTDTIRKPQIAAWKLHDKDTDSLKIETDRNDFNNNIQNYNRIEIINQILSQGNYLDDKLEGLWIFYYDNHLIDKNKTTESIAFYKGDSVILNTFYKKESIKSEVEFKNGLPIGQLRIYYDNGQLMFSGEILPDERFYKVTEYYKTGGKRYEKKLSVDYVIETYTNIKDTK